jgi:glycosyltransferase involved in cell wall biosynthesis
MKLSIITVVYNRKETIENTILSVLNQTYSDVEYIVIDGASSDGTLDILKQYQSKFSQLVSEPDKGMYDALNKGIQRATGDVIGILHADDEFAENNILETIVSYMQEHEEIDCVYGDVGFVHLKNPGKIVRYYSSAVFHRELFRYGFMPAHTSFFCYRKYFEIYGHYRTDMEIAADFDLLLRFLKKHQLKAGYLPQMFVKMNTGGTSTRGISSTYKINKEIRQILREHQIPSSYWHLYSRYLIKIQEFWKRK